MDLLALHCATEVAQKAGVDAALSFRSCPGSPEPLVADYGLVGELLRDRPPAVRRLVVEALEGSRRAYSSAIANATLGLMERAGYIARPKPRQRRWLTRTGELTHLARRAPSKRARARLAERLADVISQRPQHSLAPPLARWWRLEIAHVFILVLSPTDTLGGPWAEAAVALALESDADLVQLVEEISTASPHNSRVVNALSAIRPMHGTAPNHTHTTLQIADWLTRQLGTMGTWVLPALLMCISVAHVLQLLHGELAASLEPLIADVVWRTLAMADEGGASGATS